MVNTKELLVAPIIVLFNRHRILFKRNSLCCFLLQIYITRNIFRHIANPEPFFNLFTVALAKMFKHLEGRLI